jgi:hypothetical protein
MAAAFQAAGAGNDVVGMALEPDFAGARTVEAS